MRYRLKSFTLQIVAESPLGAVANPQGAVEILKQIFATLDQDQEHFIVLALSQKNKVIGYKVCHSGGMNSSAVDPKIVFRNALLLGASHIIVSHNHPGGDPTPSKTDDLLTRKLILCGISLDLDVTDHIILGGEEFYSYEQHRKL